MSARSLSLNDAVAAERRVGGLLWVPREEALCPGGRGQVEADHLLGARREDLVVQLVAVVRVLRHQEAPVDNLSDSQTALSKDIQVHSEVGKGRKVSQHSAYYFGYSDILKFHRK